MVKCYAHLGQIANKKFSCLKWLSQLLVLRIVRFMLKKLSYLYVIEYGYSRNLLSSIGRETPDSILGLHDLQVRSCAICTLFPEEKLSFSVYLLLLLHISPVGFPNPPRGYLSDKNVRGKACLKPCVHAGGGFRYGEDGG